MSASLAIGAWSPVLALDSLDLSVTGPAAETLEPELNTASILRSAQAEGTTEPQDLLSAALSDYNRLVETLYANGYYSGRVSILIDGREAALIPPLDTPEQISTIAVSVDPGRPFRFGTTRIAPLAPDHALPTAFATGQRARATVLRDATQGAVEGWREAGHARAEVAGQQITADHAANRLDAQVDLAPGPLVRFGSLQVAPGSAVTPRRVRKIAGLPEGEVFSPEALRLSAQRLRRTGAFRSVQLEEGTIVPPDNRMDVTAQLVDEAPRRIGAGAEISSFEGLRLSGFWMHRNLLGGAERLRVEGEVSGIGGQRGGTNYRLSVRGERPASYGPDTSFWFQGLVERLDEPEFETDRASIIVGAHRIFSDTLEVEVGLGLETEDTTDAFGTRDFTLFTLPVSLTWDRRDEILNPTSGSFLRADITPFIGIEGADSGGRLMLDGRAYRALDDDARFVLAGRAQVGSLLGAALDRTPPRFLFYSGGGGTVRGQPYQSLGVTTGGLKSGGRSFVGLSGELRAKVRGDFSAVGFVDAGYVGSEAFFDGSGDWHAGAGLGLRYDTVVGPIRLDVAAPVSGSTGDGVQIYIGIGQSF
ncbi:autotransporter assembly complex protein TamA [Lacimonas salitolerans]|uniref:Autotransporter assembly complex family protein n=1 Tax=Lacimonas salitolerans TaxID=1323750 RepID=A0ABW4EBU7_9RHOB